MSRWRHFALPVVLWVYGIATTTTLVSVWGRAVVVDAEAVAEAASLTATADPVAERVQAWLEREASSQAGTDSSAAGQMMTDLTERPALEAPLRRLVREVVVATSQPGESTIDVAGILRPAVPALTAGLNASGMDMTSDEVSVVVDGLDPLVIGSVESEPVIGSGSNTARSLYLATVIGVALMLGSGWASMRLAADSKAMRRSLVNRLAISAGGFVVMLWLGAWIVDPGAGRAPFRSAAAQVIGSKLWIPALIALISGYAGWHWRKRQVPAPLSHDRKTPGREADDPDPHKEDSGGGEQQVDSSRAGVAASQAKEGRP